MPKLVDTARVSSPDGTIWRTCSACQILAPLQPDTERCEACRLGPAPIAPSGGGAR